MEPGKRRKAQVIAAHAPFGSTPLVLAAGDVVRVGRRSDEYPAWVWCENDNGAGWVPEAYVDVGLAVSTATRAYTSREIAVAKEDVVSVLERYGGWAFVRTVRGEEGWILERCLGDT
jgi:hypothetical protein